MANCDEIPRYRHEYDLCFSKLTEEVLLQCCEGDACLLHSCNDRTDVVKSTERAGGRVHMCEATKGRSKLQMSVDKGREHVTMNHRLAIPSEMVYCARELRAFMQFWNIMQHSQ